MGPGSRPADPAAGGRAASSSCHSGEVRRAEGAQGRGGLVSERCAVRAGAAGRAAGRAVCGRRLSGLERRGRARMGAAAGGAGCGGRGVPRDSPEARPGGALGSVWARETPRVGVGC